ncbi:glucan 1,4-alpha-glucosidase [Haloarculaceae archaeon H-GB2-1]|nr:glucan 1,4-alpha-glucosidase [Haloarculaceae archaeon H-GB1-1]MEA5387409.1 glucan 1,4-alpha-glucosidase [Haloarculaceae archaeon H-GB11]MEA5408881.1 glucan 1,4-alpha-glucosidase [Haloarculaceae archaeon H-GB2-1]
MKFRTALHDFGRERDAGEPFPGERRTTTGTFSGSGTRLVHVAEDGSLRDFSSPLGELTGLDGSRFGVELPAETLWVADASARQRYVGDSAVVETVHDFGDWRLLQRDETTGSAHVTRFELRGDPPAAATLRGLVRFSPDGREGQQANLVHDGVVHADSGDETTADAVEVYHRREHDFLCSSTGLVSVEPSPLPEFDEVCEGRTLDATSGRPSGRYEESKLTGTFGFTAPFEDGSLSIVTLLTDHREVARVEAFERLRDVVDDVGDQADADSGVTDDWAWTVPADAPFRDALVDDLRVISLLSAESGARMAGPEFDDFTQYTGGYGYTWFRDDAEIARALLTGATPLGVAIDDWADRSVDFYYRTQLGDGSWPHRVWPADGSLAPGWANARLEGGSNVEYQADQTASVAAFLATYLRRGEPAVPTAVTEMLDLAVDSLDESLADDGLPQPCQNAWENMTGRFTHTAATFLHAYAAVARAPVGPDLRAHASEQAAAVADGLDSLWTGDRYALREHDGTLDERFDASTFALAGALEEYTALTDDPEPLRDRVVEHTTTTLDGLSADRAAVRGLIRFVGDDWRTHDQTGEKVWTVSTVWGAAAAADLGVVLRDAGDDRAGSFFDRSRDLLGEVLPGGSLVRANGYLPEQFFDDGTPDSATPLAWPHALRFATIGRLAAADELPTSE